MALEVEGQGERQEPDSRVGDTQRIPHPVMTLELAFKLGNCTRPAEV